MSVRSFAHSCLLVATVAGCARTKSKPEADPAKVTALAKLMLQHAPGIAAVPSCTTEQLNAGLPMSQLSLLKLGKDTIPEAPERAEWINPSGVDHPSVRTLIDATAETTAQRQAAAELLRAKAFVVWRVDMVNVPLALEFKELKRGAVGMRAIGYDRRGHATCALVFTVQNDKAVSENAMDLSDKALVDPAVAKMLRDDLGVQLLAKIESLKAGKPSK
ncbi:MAG: hypothetical protein JWP01_3905 [Myxococcales bacterium]|nr:hypothetical protein [Myxococcales bacterium]